jgi:hypothetical protein
VEAMKTLTNLSYEILLFVVVLSRNHGRI